MTHRHIRPLSFWQIIKKGLVIGKKSFMSLIPLTVSMATLVYVLQPRAIPTFMDPLDWVFLLLFLIGVFFVSAFHASVVFRMDRVLHKKTVGLEAAIVFGIRKSLWVFLITMIYACIVLLGLALLIIPGIYLGVLFYFALFLSVIDKYNKKTPWYKKIILPFTESAMLVSHYWWRVMALLIIIAVALFIADFICVWILEHQVVVPLLFGILARAVLMIFWYGCVFSMMYELKYRNRLWRKKNTVDFLN